MNFKSATLKFFIPVFIFLNLFNLSEIKSQTETDTASIIDIFDLSLEELLQLKVVTAGKTEQTINESPAIISVITAEQIRQRGYSNLAELLNSLPGVYVLDDYLQYNAGIRGINSGMESWSRVFKLMIDNQSVSFRATAENWLGEELIPISSIERVEIVRGPVSTIYGANAFLGVVNIITKKGENIDGLTISGGSNLVNNNLGYNGEIAIGKKIKNFDILLSYSKIYNDKSNLKIRNMQNQTTYSEDEISRKDLNQSQSVFAKASLDLKRKGIFTLSYSLQNLDNYAQFQNWSILSDSNRIVMSNFYTKLKYSNNFFDKKIYWNISSAYSSGNPTSKQNMYVRNNILEHGYLVKRDVGFNSYDLATDISYIFKNRSNISIGFDHTIDFHNLQTYFRKDLSGNFTMPLQSKEFGDTTFINTGLYIIGTLYPFKKLDLVSLSASVRQDFQNIYGQNTSYRFGLILPFNKKLYFKLLYGNSYKEPASTQLYTNSLYTNGIIGNSELKPEKAQSMEFVTSIVLNENFNIILTPFYSKIVDKVEIMPHFSNIRATNLSNITSIGGEGEIQYFSRKVSFYTNVSYQQSIIEEPDPFIPTKIIEKEVRLFPKLMVKTGINLHIRKIKTNINLEARYIDKIIASPQNLQVFDPVFLTKEYTLPQYFITDLTISSVKLYLFEGKETIIKLKISNILNTEYFMPGFKNYDIYGYGRNFQLKLIQSI